MKNQYRINEQIRVREVRIVGDGESTVVSTREALDMAHDQGVDLVEISPNANPPVCRLIDYSKFLYQQKKRQKEMKAKQVKVEVKEIRFGPQTDDHDYNFKLKHAKEFLPRSKARRCSSIWLPRKPVWLRRASRLATARPPRPKPRSLQPSRWPARNPRTADSLPTPRSVPMR